MDIEHTTLTISEVLPSIIALIGIGVSWGSLASKIDNERGRTDEVIKRIEDRIASSAEKREEVFRRMEKRIKSIDERHILDRASIIDEVKKIETKIDIIYEKVANMNVCRGIDCIYRLEYERNLGDLRHVTRDAREGTKAKG